MGQNITKGMVQGCNAQKQILHVAAPRNGYLITSEEQKQQLSHILSFFRLLESRSLASLHACTL